MDENMRRDRTKLNLKAFDIYGLSEIIGRGVAADCDIIMVSMYMKIIFCLKS